MGKTAFITGAARRIGAAMVRDLCAHGWQVGFSYSSSAKYADALAEETGAKAYALDLLDQDNIPCTFDRTAQDLGTIDMLVNNASVFEPDGVDTIRMDLWRRHFAVHLEAPSMLASCFASQGLQEGLIVNIIDQRVWRLNPNFYSYTLSKSALWTATQTLSQALAPKIRVNAIGPGPTLANERQGKVDFEKQVSAVPLERGAKLEEFGATLRYLWEARSITGQMIALDGGQHLSWETPDVAGIKE